MTFIARNPQTTRLASDQRWFSTKLAQGFLVLAIVIAALIPRVSTTVVLGIDEARLWRTRSETFLTELRAGNFAETDVAYHPGVITLWLGASGVVLNRVVNGPDYYDVDPVGYFALLRLPIALFNAIGIGVAYLLLRRLLNTRMALLAALFWIFDPFVVGQSQILHTDAPVMLLAFLTMLTALIALGFDHHDAPAADRIIVRWRWWLAGAVLFGLTVVAKLNGVLTIGAIGLVLLLRYRDQWGKPDWWLRYIQVMAAFGLASAVAFVAAFPGMWVEPVATFTGMFNRANDLAQDGHPQLFFGQVSEDPGLLFYVVTTLFRFTPLLSVGLLLAPLGLVSRALRPYRSVLAALAIYTVVFFVITSLEPKKIDRYILPIFPALFVFGAAGFVGVGTAVSRWLTPRLEERQRAIAGIVAFVAVGVGALVQLAGVVPYAIAYYNPLLGGLPAAASVLTAGWGEGLEQAAAFINEDSQGECRFVLSDYTFVTDVFTECQTMEARSCAFAEFAAHPADSYVVLYLSYVQREMNMTLQNTVRDAEPVYVARIGGVPMAWVYASEDIDIDVLREAGERC